MTEGHRFYCNNCKEPFTPKLKEKRTKDGGAKQWFTCPHCQMKYPVCRITRRGLVIRAQLQSCLKASPGWKRDNAEHIKRLQEDMQREVTKVG